ncbi:Fe-S cluster assembly protein SufD [Roseofilum sp. BLCC_M91]|uniref:Fe-S cluster assembly protein SufD n=1 Tax=Roseofilum halophilum BLCC-M91 TaxID=3022259 RepID=A0ABT7BPZ0_9CYAN|nr:Fe-S cluster assembly protein SufD [Roseofilum halophilum]MDJ1181255.1 Fe-S cluster assembly protein SufD [Roseofilum halophilum BLCC-M91]
MSTLSIGALAPTELNRENPRFQAVQQLLNTRLGFDKPELDPALVSLIQAVREHGAAIASELQFPSSQDEEWRFTDISRLLGVEFQPATVPSEAFIDITPFILPEAEHSRLVLVNGVYSPELSDLSGVNLDTVTYLLSAAVPEAKLNPYLGKQPGNQEVFTALNSASLQDGALVWIPQNQVVETPIHVLFLSVEDREAAIASPRTLVVAGANSSVTVVEQYVTISSCPAAPGVTPYFSNAVSEVWLEDNAQVNHTRIQQEGQQTIHISKTAITQNRDSRYTLNTISLGAGLSRHNIDVIHQGEGTQTTLNGLTEITGQQCSDTHSSVNHLYPNGSSNQLHKCIVDQKAHGIFNGKVFVPKAAQLTNAQQLNRSLVLSDKAKVDTKPQLQITADNVKCSHGATVSQLEEEEVFYLQSRGLSKEASRHLLIDAFANEILARIPLTSLQGKLAQCLSCRTDF